MPEDGARRSRRAICSHEHPALLAQLDLAEFELAQLGDRLLAGFRDQPHQLDLEFGDLAAVLGELTPRPGQRCPCSRASSRCGVSRRVIWVRPWVISVCWASISLVIRSTWSLVDGLQRLEALVLLGDLRLLLFQLRRLVGLQLAPGVELLLLRLHQLGDRRDWPAGAISSGWKVMVSRPSRSASSRLLRARISNHWPSTVPSSGAEVLAVELDQDVARLHLRRRRGR